MDIKNLLLNDWKNILESEFKKDYFLKLESFLVHQLYNR